MDASLLNMLIYWPIFLSNQTEISQMKVILEYKPRLDWISSKIYIFSFPHESPVPVGQYGMLLFSLSLESSSLEMALHPITLWDSGTVGGGERKCESPNPSF